MITPSLAFLIAFCSFLEKNSITSIKPNIHISFMYIVSFEQQDFMTPDNIVVPILLMRKQLFINLCNTSKVKVVFEEQTNET